MCIVEIRKEMLITQMSYIAPHEEHGVTVTLAISSLGLDGQIPDSSMTSYWEAT